MKKVILIRKLSSFISNIVGSFFFKYFEKLIDIKENKI